MTVLSSYLCVRLHFQHPVFHFQGSHFRNTLTESSFVYMNFAADVFTRTTNFYSSSNRKRTKLLQTILTNFFPRAASKRENFSRLEKQIHVFFFLRNVRKKWRLSKTLTNLDLSNNRTKPTSMVATEPKVKWINHTKVSFFCTSILPDF